MAQQIINTGAVANDGTGDPLRTAFTETNSNFTEIYTAGPVGSNVRIANNTILTINTNGNLVLAPNGVGVVQSNVNIVPNQANVRNLGSSTARWGTVYAKYVDITNGTIYSGDLTVTGNLSAATVTTPELTVNTIRSDDSTVVNIQDGVEVDGDVLVNGNVTADYVLGDGSQLMNISVGNSGAVQFNWQGSLSNQGGTPSDTYSTLQFDSNGMPTLDGTTAYQQRVDYSPYLQVLAPRVESTDFGIVAGPGITVVGYDDNYNTPRSAYLSVQDQANATQQWDFGILGNGSNNYSISDRTNSNTWTFGITGDLSAPGNVSAGNVLTSAEVIASGVIQTGTGFSTGGYLSVDGSTDLHDTNIIGNLSVNTIRSDDSTIVLIQDGVEIDGDAVVNGNVTGAYILGNGSQLTGLPASYGNANVTALLSNLGSNVISGTGNITTTGLVSATGNITAGNVNSPTLNNSGNISVAASGNTWIFGTDGSLTLPIGVSIDSSVSPVYPKIIADSGKLFSVQGQGNTGSAALAWTVDPDAAGQYAAVAVTRAGGDDLAKVVLQAQSDSGNVATVKLWKFDETGNLILPGGSTIDETVGIKLAPAGGADAGQALVIYPTGNLEGDHIHLAAYGANTELYLGTDDHYVKLANTGNVVINSNDGVGNSAQWTFGTNGNLTFPTGNLVITPDDPAGNIASIVSTDHQLAILSTGANGAVATVWVEDIGNVGTSNIAAVYANPTPESKIVRIAVGQNGGPGPNLWDFDTTGNLTLPTGGQIIVSGGLISSGASPAPSINGFGSINSITVSASGNITGGNVLTAGNISATGNVVANNIGNIAALNLNGNANTVLYGNGVFAAAAASSSYGNANVATFLAAYGSNTISTSGNITAGNLIGNISITGNVTGTSSNVTLVAGSYNWTFDNTGNLTLPGNTFSVNYANNTPVNVVARAESSWSVPVGNSTQSFTVGLNETYYLWVDCNIPNGILTWNATATVTNNNVPVVGAQYAWVYTGGGTPVDFTSIPNQFIGTADTIVRSNVAPSATTNRFDFGINNTSGGNITVRYGWIAIS